MLLYLTYCASLKQRLDLNQTKTSSAARDNDDLVLQAKLGQEVGSHGVAIHTLSSGMDTIDTVGDRGRAHNRSDLSNKMLLGQRLESRSDLRHLAKMFWDGREPEGGCRRIDRVDRVGLDAIARQEPTRPSSEGPAFCMKAQACSHGGGSRVCKRDFMARSRFCGLSVRLTTHDRLSRGSRVLREAGNGRRKGAKEGQTPEQKVCDRRQTEAQH